MNKGDLNLAITRHKQVSDIPAESWVGNTRAIGQSSLQVGDIFKIEADAKPYINAKLGDAEHPVQYCYVDLFDEAHRPLNQVRTLYPKSLCKKVLIYTRDEDGNIVSTGKMVHSEGQPCVDFASVDTIDEAIKKIAGKFIRVKYVQNVSTANYPKRDRIVSSNVMTLEYV